MVPGNEENNPPQMYPVESARITTPATTAPPNNPLKTISFEEMICFFSIFISPSHLKTRYEIDRIF
jgi:hypothetical protein